MSEATARVLRFGSQTAHLPLCAASARVGRIARHCYRSRRAFRVRRCCGRCRRSDSARRYEGLIDRTLRSKRYDFLFFAGAALDFDFPACGKALIASIAPERRFPLAMRRSVRALPAVKPGLSVTELRALSLDADFDFAMVSETITVTVRKPASIGQSAPRIVRKILSYIHLRLQAAPRSAHSVTKSFDSESGCSSDFVCCETRRNCFCRGWDVRGVAGE